MAIDKKAVDSFIQGYAELCEKTGITIEFNVFGVGLHALRLEPYGALIQVLIDNDRILIRPMDKIAELASDGDYI